MSGPDWLSVELDKAKELASMVHDVDSDELEFISNESGQGGACFISNGDHTHKEANHFGRNDQHQRDNVAGLTEAHSSRKLDIANIDFRVKLEHAGRRLESDLSFKINKFIIEFCGLLCYNDIFGGENRLLTGSQPVSSSRRCLELKLFGLAPIRLFSYNHNEPSAWYRSTRRLWPKLIMLLYLFCSCHVLYYLIRQYRYDYYQFRLDRVRWLNQTWLETGISKRNLEREDYLLAHIERELKQLKCIGAPHIHMSFAIECICLYLLVTPLGTYLGGLVTSYNFYIVRNFLDFSNEQRNASLMVGQQVRKFLDSSRNYTRSLLSFDVKADLMHQQSDHVFKHKRRQETRQMFADVGAFETLSKFNLDHVETSQAVYKESLSSSQLMRMLKNNDLQPLNQTTKWIRRQSRYYAAMGIVFLSYCISMIPILVLIVYYCKKSDPQLAWTDFTVDFELIFLFTIINLTTFFYGSSLIFTCIDQAMLAKKLRKLIELIISLNELRFRRIRLEFNNRISNSCSQCCDRCGEYDKIARAPHHLHASDSCLNNGLELMIRLDQPTIEDQMNNDILLAIMHYKIFVANMMVSMRALTVIAATVVFIMFQFPIVGRLHIPYFNTNLDPQGRMRLLIVSLACCVILPANMCLLPVCYLHKRCLELYNELNSLLAHATDVISRPEGCNVYDRHAILVLRKELSQHEKTVTQFAVSFAGLTFSYSSLVRLHFYFGAIILSIFSVGHTQEHEMSAKLFSDPFGIF